MRTPMAAVRRLLVVLAVVIVAAYTIVQAINRPVADDVTIYHAEFDDVFGLREHGDVRIRGVQVGKVLSIDLQPSGLAMVKFTVRDQDRLHENDRLAIRFQNLVGQRYLAVTKAGSGHEVAAGKAGNAAATVTTPTDRGPMRDPDKTIPVAATVGSFDITHLFNGLRPLLQGADPQVFNRFAENMVDLLQGEDGIGVGDVLADIDKLTAFAVNKQDLIKAIIANLGVISNELEGKSSLIESLMAGMGQLFDALEGNLDDLKGAYRDGATVFPPIVELMKHSFDLSLGGHDMVRARLMELIPNTEELTNTLQAVPALLANINAQVGRLGAVANCSKGTVALPAMGNVLLAGGRVTLCKA